MTPTCVCCSITSANPHRISRNQAVRPWLLPGEGVATMLCPPVHELPAQGTGMAGEPISMNVSHGRGLCSGTMVIAADGDALADTLWSAKPWWCQPWSIVLTGIVVVAAGGWISHRPWVALVLSIPVGAWWILFLVLVPRAFEQARHEGGGGRSGLRAMAFSPPRNPPPFAAAAAGWPCSPAPDCGPDPG